MQKAIASSHQLETSDRLSFKSSRIIHHDDSSGNGFLNSGDTPEKRFQRQLVVSHFLDLDRDHLRCVSLPGAGWDVERAIFNERPNHRFIGCERDNFTFLKSQVNMPDGLISGMKSMKYRRHWLLEDQFKVDVISTNTNVSSLIHFDIADVIRCSGLEKSIIDISKTGKNKFPISRPFDLFWLDSFSPLGSQNNLSMLQAMFGASLNRKESHFAITFMIGRDTPQISNLFRACPGSDSIERRAAFIGLMATKHERSIIITKCHRHRSFNRDGQITMGTVLGKIMRSTKTGGTI